MLLAWEMGTGKTLVSILLAKHRIAEGMKVGVVCPAYLRLNYLHECQKWAPELQVEIHTTKKPASRDCDILIMSYDVLRVSTDPLRTRKFLILDEADHLCNRQSGRSKSLMEHLRAYQPHLLLMTGTPMRNRIPDLYNLFYILDLCWPHGFRKAYVSFNSFCAFFCNIEEIRTRYSQYAVKKYYGFRNTEHLRPWIDVFWMKLKLSQVLDLPPITFETLHVEGITEALEEALEQQYEASINGVIPDKHEYGENVGEHISKAKAMSAAVKAKQTVEFALSLLNQAMGPIVIFSDHLESSGLIYETLYLQKKRVAIITGQTPPGKRQQNITDFQAGKLDVLVGTIGALQAGITLTKGNISIFNDYSWVPSANAQAYFRIYRISQTRPCTIYEVVGGRIDAKIMAQLREKTLAIKEVTK